MRNSPRSITKLIRTTGYTSVVGTMLAEELANAEDQVGTLDHTCFRVCPDYLLDCRSSGACPGGGTLRCSLQRGFSFVGREGARARDVSAVDHGEAPAAAAQFL